jgi:hypothetical protein
MGKKPGGGDREVAPRLVRVEASELHGESIVRGRMERDVREAI